MLEAQKEIRKLANKKIAEHSKRFFKTGKGEYGEGDHFLGVRVPVVRSLAKKYRDLSLSKTSALIKSKYHEERLFAVILLCLQYQKSKTEEEKNKIYKFYIKNFKHINNWDIVDASAHKIVGKHLLNKSRKPLYSWVKSSHLWTRRVAIMANWWLIRENDLSEIFKLAEILLKDKHDLMHKSVGWMLREAGKKDRKKLISFLDKHHSIMPRTMLRYAIEKLPEKKRKSYLNAPVTKKI